MHSLWQGSAYWASLAELTDTLKAYMANHTQMITSGTSVVELTQVGFWRKLRTCDLVCVDELGTKAATDHRYDSLLRLLDERAGRPLILTGNLEPVDKLGEVYDDRVHSRILAGTIIEVCGDDQRSIGLETRFHRV